MKGSEHLRQLDLFRGEYGENDAHIAKLEREAGIKSQAGVYSVYQKPRPVVIDPWPVHMRFD